MNLLSEKENEDYCLRQETEKGNLYIIADGFGGHKNGYTASKMACETIKENFRFDKIEDKNFEKYIKEIFGLTNERIFSKSDKMDQKRMATTLSILIIKNSSAYIRHVGDSRIYRLRENNLEKLTQDHTKIQKLLNEGKILHKDISTHQEKNFLYSAVGYNEEINEIFTKKLDVRKEDIYLLLTDGVYNTLSDQEIVQQFNDKVDISEIESNISKLLKVHGEDNASFLIVYPEFFQKKYLA